jgi:hypothetical protein
MSEREKYEALAKSLLEAIDEAINLPSAANVREVSKLINACAIQRAAVRHSGEMDGQ